MNEVVNHDALSGIAIAADGRLQLRTIGEAYAMATLLARAGMVPKGMTTEQAAVAILRGLRLGMGPMESVQGISVINGRPTLWGDAMVATVKASGLLVNEKTEYLPSLKDCQGVRYTAWRKGVDEPYVGFFSVSMAKTAGLWGKSGPWTSNPIRMLMQRARAFALRDGFADVLQGMGSAEEALDVAAQSALPASDAEVESPRPRRKRASAGALVAPAAPAEALEVSPLKVPEGVKVSADFEGDAPKAGDGGQYTHGFAPDPAEEKPADGGDFLD